MVGVVHPRGDLLAWSAAARGSAWLHFPGIFSATVAASENLRIPTPRDVATPLAPGTKFEAIERVAFYQNQ